MGNAIATFGGCKDAATFEQSAGFLISAQKIQPWDAGQLSRERVNQQELLRRRSPLGQVPVELGLSWFQDKVGRGVAAGGGITRDQFVEVSKHLLASRSIPAHYTCDLDLVDVYQSIDYGGTGRLSVGELAAGLVIFFKGTERERKACVFKLLDREQHGYLCQTEFDEYLKPVVGSMVPAEAAVLKPLLVRHVGDVLFAEAVGLDKDKTRCSFESFLGWSTRHDGLVHEVQQLIEAKVYKVWMERNLQCAGHHLW